MAGLLERLAVAEQQEGRIRTQHQRVDLEGDLLGVGVRSDFAVLLRLADQLHDHREPLGVELLIRVPTGPPPRASNSAAAAAKKQPPEDLPLDVGEEGIAQAEDLGERTAGGEARTRHLAVEDLLGRIDGRELRSCFEPKCA